MSLQHQQIQTKAQELGLSVKDISHMFQDDAMLISNGKKTALFLYGTPVSKINLEALNYCDNKQLSKIAFQACQIPSSPSIIFHDPKEDAVIDFFKEGKTYVCKPLVGTNGIGVVMNIKTLKEIELYHNNNQHLSQIFLLEEQIEGEDLRLQIIGGKIVAVCVRQPAFVTGNGKDSLQDLITIHQIKTRKNNPNNELVLDKFSHELIQKQNLTLDSIPALGQHVQLKYVANMSQGGVAVDVTHEIPKILHQWVNDLVDYLKLDYFGLDFIATDYTDISTIFALEINAQPEWVHHTFSDVRQHDLASLVLENVFFSYV